MSQAVQPKPEYLEKIRDSGISTCILSNMIGDYRLTVVYRESSACIEPPVPWYPEATIHRGYDWLYQGEGWATFRLFALHLTTPAEVESFLKAQDETDD